MGKMILPVMLILCLHKGLLDQSSCRETKFLSGTVGGQVTLLVNETDIVSIYWFAFADLHDQLIAITLPDKPVDIRRTEYEGRFKATATGSLIILNLTREDQVQYIANVQKGQPDGCLQRFDLRVFDALNEESCAGQTNVCSEEGTEVTLPVTQTGLEPITWVSAKDLVHFAVTTPGKPIVILDARYAERLNVTANGSLIITGLTREDQGTYGTYEVTPTSQRCAQLYNLRVTVTKSDPNQIHATRMDYTTMNTTRLAISGCVLLIACCVLSHHMKTEVMNPSTITRRRRRYS